ncbi:MAG: ACT domain-containing protein [Lentisphaeria bacterium]|nr:ACT domain-containing protein [Lentisphaeria bacterium]
MKINQLSVLLENKPGSLKDICRLLADNRIDISTLSLADTKDFGILRLIVKEWEKAKKVLTDAGFGVTVTGVVAVEVEDRPGGMCKILDTLDRYSINVEYLYAFVSPVKGRAVVILRFDAPDVAVERLSADQAVKFVGPEDIFAGK